jgi:hypothetical protein
MPGFFLSRGSPIEPTCLDAIVGCSWILYWEILAPITSDCLSNYRDWQKC